MNDITASPLTCVGSLSVGYISDYVKAYRVNSYDDITLDKIPMDGSTAYFIENGGNIYAKHWDNNGHVITVRYCKEDSNDIFESDAAFRESVSRRLDKIEQTLAVKPQGYGKKYRDYKNKRYDNSQKRYNVGTKKIEDTGE